MLKFGTGNAKLTAHTFSLPSGFSCPGADECLSKANRETGRITDSPDMKYRCFSASSESAFPATRNQRWHNFDQLRHLDMLGMIDLIETSLPCAVGTIRIHVAGDFFNQTYFDAWVTVARRNPRINFYAYTKSLNYWVDSPQHIPDNLNLTASVGGKHNHLIEKHSLKSATVVFHPHDAEKLGLEIDHDDSLAAMGTSPFALLLHGTQPAKSIAQNALRTMRKQNIQFSYPKKGRDVAV